MLNQNFDILAAILALIGAVNYALATFRGKAQPNRITWVLWMIAPAISFAVEIAQHVPLEVTLLTLAEGIGPLLVIVASFMNAKAYWKVSRFDWFCGAISVLAIILWLVTGQEDIALIFSLIASIASSIPTVIKSYAHPTTESPGDYVASFIAGIITLLTIQNWTLANYGFPVYITLECAIIAFLVLTPKRVPLNIPAVAELNRMPTLEPTPTTEPATPQPAAMPQQAMPTQSINQLTFASYPPSDILPVLNTPSWSLNPVPYGANTVLSVRIDHTSAIVQAEYIGSIDPGEGRGFPMRIEGNILTATFSATVPKGPYPIFVRAKDAHDTWSKQQPTILMVE